jgi:hypothetical protein
MIKLIVPHTNASSRTPLLQYVFSAPSYSWMLSRKGFYFCAHRTDKRDFWRSPKALSRASTSSAVTVPVMICRCFKVHLLSTSALALSHASLMLSAYASFSPAVVTNDFDLRLGDWLVSGSARVVLSDKIDGDKTFR